MKDRTGIGGRPRDGEKVKAAALNFRTDPDLYARVVAFQEAHGIRSLTRAVERLVRCGLEAPGAD